ncbi:TlpA family protein disulfide reductase [Akkermansia glycaniphila]|uniref:Alkyl hydroperoxide reductase subunit c/ thiol specific antioxidant n=1 Tax=Akkermansia glycaniphila TaxID=1679444 RepID=A0A1C7PE69_9BACT|nr:TlpA disulfide reductase family protein [Akkermansia glycaniphila]MBT9449196.1 TlpA family protein disulfide reductase [Akkermansia glycaniphila]OCA03886.1 hypothetical protein AC781_01040 [Akkermansia glycaniphila]SEH70038.1 alkyl hydroperoxide reductase subunit c/ thiol specific antioxidant [Akkermansia glycaniphila]
MKYHAPLLRPVRLACFAGCLFGASLPAMAANGNDSASAAAEVSVSDNKIGNALKDLTFQNAGKVTPKTEVPYYICLYSASWCSACRAEMPSIVRTYNSKIAKDKNVELILFNRDKTAEAGAAWAKQMKMKFPVVSKDDGSKVPGYGNKKGVLPYVYIVDKDGNEVASGSPGQILKDYKKYCKPSQ